MDGNEAREVTKELRGLMREKTAALKAEEVVRKHYCAAAARCSSNYSLTRMRGASNYVYYTCLCRWGSLSRSRYGPGRRKSTLLHLIQAGAVSGLW